LTFLLCAGKGFSGGGRESRNRDDLKAILHIFNCLPWSDPEPPEPAGNCKAIADDGREKDGGILQTSGPFENLSYHHSH